MNFLDFLLALTSLLDIFQQKPTIPTDHCWLYAARYPDFLLQRPAPDKNNKPRCGCSTNNSHLQTVAVVSILRGVRLGIPFFWIMHNEFQMVAYWDGLF